EMAFLTLGFADFLAGNDGARLPAPVSRDEPGVRVSGAVVADPRQASPAHDVGSTVVGNPPSSRTSYSLVVSLTAPGSSGARVTMKTSEPDALASMKNAMLLSVAKLFVPAGSRTPRPAERR